jgi:ribosomal protein S21
VSDTKTKIKNRTKKKPDSGVDGELVAEAGISSAQEPDLSSLSSHVRVTAKPGESAESLLRRFRQKVTESGLMERVEQLRFYEKPSQRKRQEEKQRQQKIARAQKYNR